MVHSKLVEGMFVWYIIMDRSFACDDLRRRLLASWSLGVGNTVDRTATTARSDMA